MDILGQDKFLKETLPAISAMLDDKIARFEAIVSRLEAMFPITICLSKSQEDKPNGTYGT